MRGVKAFWIATLMSWAALLATANGWACGGCFHGPQAITGVVTGHRMAFAVSEERTVLWDQIEYSGAPEDFSWVLPVLPGAYLEASNDAWFESLEAVSQVQITAPPMACAQRDSGCVAGGLGSASADSASFSGGFAGKRGVSVLHHATVGPYYAVTLRSTDGDALSSWLSDHGYVIPADIAPIIAAYVSEGADFIAVRLSPGQGVQQMTPVRVVTPGGEYLLPLRMVAAGIGESVKIVLYVIGEQRYAMPDLHEVAIDGASLTWDFSDNSSNYAELQHQALSKNLGFSYLPSFASPRALFGGLPGPGGLPASYLLSGTFFGAYSRFTDLYFAQARSNDGMTPDGCPRIAEGVVADTRIVAEPDADGMLPSEAASSRDYTCGLYTDLAAAMIGMHPGNVWLTRLELDLPKEALAMDCVTVPASEQTTVSNQWQAVKAIGRPSGCRQVIFESNLSRGLPGRGGILLLLVGLGVCRGLRRRGAR
jgi:uncharacterized protein DUF2330